MIETFLISYFLYQLQPAASQQKERGVPERGQVTVEMQYASIQSVPPGAQRVPMLTLQVTAPCERDAVIDSLRLRRRGLGESSDILSVYLMQDGRRIVEGRQPDRSGYVQFHFRDVRVPSCGTETFEVLADFSQDAAVAGEHWMTLERGGDVTIQNLSATILYGNQPSRQRTAGGIIRGTVSVEYLRLLTLVRYGGNRTIARLRLTADGEQDLEISAITLTNEGSARDEDLQDLYLRVGRNRRISSVAQELEGDTVTFLLDPPLLLQKNQKRLIEVQADVKASRRRTLQFRVQEPSDIQSVPVRTR